MKFSVRRLLAEILAVVDYRRFKEAYWRLRARDLRARYSHQDDFATLRRLIHRYGAKTVADIGCGDGRLFALYKECGVERLFAVEMSGPLHRAARERIARGEGPEHADLVLGDVASPSIAVPESDLVVAARTLQHIPPAELSAVIPKLASAARRAIYVNEILENRPRAAYIFLHDYDALLGAQGYAVADTGRLPAIGYEFKVYEKRR